MPIRLVYVAFFNTKSDTTLPDCTSEHSQPAALITPTSGFIVLLILPFALQHNGNRNDHTIPQNKQDWGYC